MTELKKIKVLNPITGKMVEGDLVEIETPTDMSHDIELTDGTILRSKFVVSRIVRIPDQYDGDGNPLYSVQHNNIISVINSPDNLKKEME